MTQKDSYIRLKAVVQLVKVNKSAVVDNLLDFVTQSQSIDIDLAAKLVLYSILKLPKKAASIEQQQSN